VVFTPTETFAIDVSGTCPSAPTYVSMASQRLLAAANQRVAYKKRLYAQRCRALSLTFLPAVFESTGALHGEFADFMKTIIDAQLERFPQRESHQTCSTRILANLNAAIHRGNAIVTRQGLLDARVANLRGQCRLPYQPRPHANWVQRAPRVRRFPRVMG
jgi:hypothetical protein